MNFILATFKNLSKSGTDKAFSLKRNTSIVFLNQICITTAFTGLMLLPISVYTVIKYKYYQALAIFILVILTQIFTVYLNRVKRYSYAQHFAAGADLLAFSALFVIRGKEGGVFFVVPALIIFFLLIFDNKSTSLGYIIALLLSAFSALIYLNSHTPFVPTNGIASTVSYMVYLFAASIIIVFAVMAFNRINDKQKNELESMLNLLNHTNEELNSTLEAVESERAKSDKLLLNILPTEVAGELKETGKTDVRYFESVTVLFADVKGFSALATQISPQELIAQLDATFSKMDEISLRFGLERIKTIGDCYMACGGLPHANKTHAFDVILAALHIQNWMNEERERRQGDFWQVRLGLHTGDAVAGVIGKTKFAYDIWGNTVNLASRMESGGEVGKVNVTEATFNLVKDYFEGDYREEIEAKNIGKVRAYFITRLKPEFSADDAGFEPNERFWEFCRSL